MNIYRDFDLSKILWYKIGGTARFLLEVSNKEDLLSAAEFLNKEKITKFMPIGLGANLVFTDDYYDGAIIRIDKKDSHIGLLDDNKIEAFSGELLNDVIQFSFDRNLTGLEWAGGLPSTIGAAVRGNVGAFGGEIKDSLVTGEILELDNGEIKTRVLQNEEFKFGYRDSILKHDRNLLLMTATFGLKPSTHEEVDVARKTFESNIEYRKEHHPVEYPNCGSVFKNIKKPDEVEKVLSVVPEIREKIENNWHGKVSMGYLIHYLGLEGYRVGNAQVSKKHNNFIINLGGAKFTDVITIIRTIQDKCDETFGFRPETEIEIVD